MPMVEENIIATRVDKNGRELPIDKPRIYLVLMQFLDETRTWELIRGEKLGENSAKGIVYYTDYTGELHSIREEVFKELESNLEDLNIVKSFVMTQDQTMKESITAYSFMRLCLENDIVVSESAQISLDELNEICESNHEDYNALYKKEIG